MLSVQNGSRAFARTCPGTGEAAQYRTAHEVQCDNPTVVTLSLEIGRIEKDWINEANGSRRRR